MKNKEKKLHFLPKSYQFLTKENFFFDFKPQSEHSVLRLDTSRLLVILY